MLSKLTTGRKLAIIAMLLICILDVVLWFFARTPRARLNVMQAVSVIFMGTLLFRLRRFDSQTREASEDSSQSVLLPWFGIALGIAVWTTALACYFISDDYGLLYFSRGVGLDGIRSVFLHGDGVFYRPLTNASYFLDRTIWNSWPAGFHLTNLLLHVLAVAGLF